MDSIFSDKLSISSADIADKEAVFKLRHDVYAVELGQFNVSADGKVPDGAQVESEYIVAKIGKKIVGFVGVTPPSSPQYSLEKYVMRGQVPLEFDESLYEIRALTVRAGFRGYFISNCLMYAAFQLIRKYGGINVVSIGHENVLNMYTRLGFVKTDLNFKVGNMHYELLKASTTQISKAIRRFSSKIKQMENNVNWKLNIPFQQDENCFHGGVSINAVGVRLDKLEGRKNVINADVLDAWFPPAPAVREILEKNLDWVIKTSPPTHSEGLREVIGEVRGVSAHCILPGAGSSNLIFLAFRKWLNQGSRVLIFDPTYGEYSYILEKIICCQIDKVFLKRENGYRVNYEMLEEKLKEKYDLFVWVNPNSPTGLHVSKNEVEALLNKSENCKRIWIDETYVDFVGQGQSLEPLAVKNNNLIVCKSLSKAYALSGLRVGYLCSSPSQINDLRIITPPWSVSLPAQIAAIYALKSYDYYESKYAETRILRKELITGLNLIGIKDVIYGSANFVLFHLPEGSESAATIIKKCIKHGLYLRDVSNMGSKFESSAIRTAVKDGPTNKQILNILRHVLNERN